MQNDEEKPIEPVFRNGTVTVVGVVLSFSLGFLTQWAANPLPWNMGDLPAVILLAIGILLQMRALWDFLHLRSLQPKVYERATRVFFIGVIVTGSGVFAALIADFVEMISKAA
ncbi:hypothetical protein [Sinorhizobium sp. A49]|uniref:hypothetical protein n=1 Tax=Sinorhizobium sp. A49 TaxID=1945861 RepID=UPI0009871526|nr:hypothetical protein [Sinorhizobium sp. A49]OOG74445.1 hypothetical protein B0E45_05585 [Sinorhizobium sp. A49]